MMREELTCLRHFLTGHPVCKIAWMHLLGIGKNGSYPVAGVHAKWKKWKIYIWPTFVEVIY
jgi:hypothetical protein